MRRYVVRCKCQYRLFPVQMLEASAFFFALAYTAQHMSYPEYVVSSLVQQAEILKAAYAETAPVRRE